MTDTTDDKDGRRPPRGRPSKPRPGGDRPRPSGGGGDRPFRSRSDGDRPRPRRDGDDRPGRPGGERPRGERPARARAAGDDRPRRSGDDRPRAPRRDGDRPFRKTSDRPPRPERAERRPEEAAPEAQAVEPAEERIAKVIARAGVASRRDAEAMIAEGRVTLNGEPVTSPALNVSRTDQITVDGEPLPLRERTRLWIFHKPRGLVTTARDPEGRPTVFESLPEDLPRVVTIGRLDINTEGLLLLTNDGGLAKVIAHPDTGWLRRYKVRAHGEITQDQLDKLRNGITIDEIEYGPVEAKIDRAQGDNIWLTIGLREGKNREIKRILEHLGLQVNRLIRLSFGPFQLGDLESGLVEEVRTKVLKDQLGTKLAEEAGVDFESPVREPIAPFGSPKERAPERDGPPRRGGRPERTGGERYERGPRPERGRAERDVRPGGAGRGRDEAARESRGPERPPRGAARRSVWRDESAAAEGDEAHRGKKIPRRGADPKAARAATAERPRERVGAIEAGEGRSVMVERLVGAPKPERERPSRRPAPAGDDRPRRREGSGERPASSFRGRDEDRWPDRSGGERPPRGAAGRPDRPRAGGDERPPRTGADRPPPRRSDRDDRPKRSFGGARSEDGRPPRAGAPGRSGPPRRDAGGGGGARFERDGAPPRRGPPRGKPGGGGKPDGCSGPRKGPPRGGDRGPR